MLILKSKLVNFVKNKKTANIHLTIDLLEINEEKDLEIVQSIGTYGYFSFSPDKLKKEVEDAMKNKTIGIRTSGMSHSQVLRGKIRLLWERDKTDLGKMTFEEYYDYWMNKIIDRFEFKILKA